jgi:hypothetical protein
MRGESEGIVAHVRLSLHEVLEDTLKHCVGTAPAGRGTLLRTYQALVDRLLVLVALLIQPASPRVGQTRAHRLRPGAAADRSMYSTISPSP